jgi:YD repeat-containing protein
MANLQPGHKKTALYILLLGLLCIAAAIRITMVLWPKPHETQQPLDAAAFVAQRRQAFARVAQEYVSQDAPRPSFAGSYPCVYVSMQEASPGPHLGECETSGMSSSPVDRFEVDLRYGSFVLRQTDLFLQDGFDVPFTRAYNSSDWIHPNPVHAFGKYSNQTYDIAPVCRRNPYTWMAIVLEDGNFVYFDRVSKGTGYADAVFQHSETSSKFYRAIIYWNGDGWTARLADGSMIMLPESYMAKKIADGAPYEIVDPAGNKLLLQRDKDRKLQEIKTPHGQEITLGYNDQGYIEHAQDSAGHWVVYLYNPGGMLIEVKDSSGRGRSYEYEGDHMTAIRDEKGALLVRNTYYDYGRIAAQEFADGTVYRYAYQWSSNQGHTEIASVLLPDGTVRTIQTAYSVPGLVRIPHE